MSSPDGSTVECCICFESKPRGAMLPVPDEPTKVWDVCKLCNLRCAYQVWKRGYQPDSVRYPAPTVRVGLIAAGRVDRITEVRP